MKVWGYPSALVVGANTHCSVTLQVLAVITCVSATSVCTISLGMNSKLDANNLLLDLKRESEEDSEDIDAEEKKEF